MVDFVELSNKRTNSVRTIEELLVEFVPQTFKHYFHNSLLKAKQQFVRYQRQPISSNPAVFITYLAKSYEALRPIYKLTDM